jgi:hypothetical protein
MTGMSIYHIIPYAQIVSNPLDVDPDSSSDIDMTGPRNPVRSIRARIYNSPDAIPVKSDSIEMDVSGA